MISKRIGVSYRKLLLNQNNKGEFYLEFKQILQKFKVKTFSSKTRKELP